MILNAYFSIAQAVASDVPSIFWRDLDKGQLDNPEAFNSLLLPALLIGFSDIDWETYGQNHQTGYGTVTLKLIVRLPAETHDTDPLFQTNLNELELAAQVDAAIKKASFVRPRTGSRAYPVNTFYVVEQTYPVCLVPDPPAYRLVPVTVQVNPQITHP